MVVVAEVGFFRRVAPALILAACGGVLLYLLPSSADSDNAASEDVGSSDGEAFPSGDSTAPPSPETPSDSASPSGSAAPSSSQRVIVGDAINFRYGTVQVKVLLDGSTIANIGVLTAPGGGYQPYTDRAIPGMKAEILAAQSTKVAAVSGATYTSEAYAQSVQSALDKA